MLRWLDRRHRASLCSSIGPPHAPFSTFQSSPHPQQQGPNCCLRCSLKSQVGSRAESLSQRQCAGPIAKIRVRRFLCSTNEISSLHPIQPTKEPFLLESRVCALALGDDDNDNQLDAAHAQDINPTQWLRRCTVNGCYGCPYIFHDAVNRVRRTARYSGPWRRRRRARGRRCGSLGSLRGILCARDLGWSVRWLDDRVRFYRLRMSYTTG